MNNQSRRYVAVILKERGKPYLATVPDFGACFAMGDTVDDAKASLPDALALHVEGMIADGRGLPAPRTRIEVLTSLEQPVFHDYVVEVEPEADFPQPSDRRAKPVQRQ
ncbi:MAG: type II toxin-antitoxin system HicB family antitoxin [Rhodospirillales bacterium]|nr:type II toxin-antitoxin system HicB family antitoxin [Rhodospirillales bacterium]